MVEFIHEYHRCNDPTPDMLLANFNIELANLGFMPFPWIGE